MKKLHGKLSNHQDSSNPHQKGTKLYEYVPNIKNPFSAQSFHSKALFINFGNQEFLATIGSSNYAQRSYRRDNELNFFVYSRSKKLAKIMESEKNFILEDCREYDPKNNERRGVFGRLQDSLFWVLARWNNFC